MGEGNDGKPTRKKKDYRTFLYVFYYIVQGLLDKSRERASKI
jgi:hypothetical protein